MYVYIYIYMQLSLPTTGVLTMSRDVYCLHFDYNRPPECENPSSAIGRSQGSLRKLRIG